MLYFAYGMNTDPRSMRTRCPAAVLAGPALLLGYELAFDYHCDIRARLDSQVEGALWSITPECLDQLDRLEGYPSYYTRFLTIVLHRERSCEAWVYQMQHTREQSLPGHQYLGLVARGYREVGLPRDQLRDALHRARNYESTPQHS